MCGAESYACYNSSKELPVHTAKEKRPEWAQGISGHDDTTLFHLPFKIATITFCKSCNSDCSFRVVQPLSTPPKPVKIHPGGTGMGVGLAVIQRCLSTQIILWTVSLSCFCISKLGTSYPHISHDSLFTFRSCCYRILFCIYFLCIMKTQLFISLHCLLVLLLLLLVFYIPLYSPFQFTAQLGSN